MMQIEHFHFHSPRTALMCVAVVICSSMRTGLTQLNQHFYMG